MTRLFNEFFKSERSGGLILIGCTVLSLVIANSQFSLQYQEFWQIHLGIFSVEHWINEGLMTIFFLMIGLELEREFYIGELSNIKEAILPLVAAIGGMIVPLSIYYGLNHGSPTQSGAAIPMATDIAFALGILSLLGSRVPMSLKVFLTALAVIDDLGAILVIAIFYTKTIFAEYLLGAMGCLLFLFMLNRMKVKSISIYLFIGMAMWYCFLNSGVHSTIAGVLFAFALPFEQGEEESTSFRIQSFLHKPVAYIILPLFALVNTAIVIDFNWNEIIRQKFALGIFFGLVFGKPIGIFIFSKLAQVSGLINFSSDMNHWRLLGLGCLGGIGFTMSIFITILSLNGAEIVNQAKFIIIISSVISGSIGYFILRRSL